MPYYDNIWYTVSKFIVFTNYKNILQNNFRKKKLKLYEFLYGLYVEIIGTENV